MKKVAAILSVIALLLCSFTSVIVAPAAAEETIFYVAGYDSNTSRDWSKNAFFSRMQEKTGITLRFNQFASSASWHDYLAGLTKESKLPDFFFKADLQSWEMIDLYQKGVLIDLTPYIDTCMPNLSRLMAQYPQILEAISVPVSTQEGEPARRVILSLPYYNETPVNSGLWINTRWLKNTGSTVDEITSLEALEKVLYAFKDNDANINGKSDEVPLTFLGSFDLKFLAGFFGVVANNYNMYEQDGKACFLLNDTRFYDFLVWAKKLYADGVLDKKGYTTADQLRRITSESDTNIYGAMISPAVSSVVPQSWSSDYTLLMPFANTLWRKYYSNTIAGTMAVTSACSSPEAVLSWADHLYSVEGAVLASIGEKDSEYRFSNNEYSLDAFIAQGKEKGMVWTLIADANNLSTVQTTKLIAGSNAIPGYSANAFQSLYADNEVTRLYTALDKFDQVTVSPFPVYFLTTQQLAYISPIQNRIGYAVDLQIARWVTGDAPLTPESYNAFIESLDQLDDFIAFWQNILDSAN